MGGCASSGRYEEGQIVRKIAVVGNSGVGKTCLIHRYIHDEFDEMSAQEFIPTALKMDEKVQQFGGGKEVTLHIYDTGGEETFKHLRKLNYPRSDAAIICFSLDDKESLKAVTKNWVPEMKRICPGIPLVLAGLRRDLRDEGSIPDDYVKQRAGVKVAKQHKMAGYVECSSKMDEGVEQVFEKIAAGAAKRKNKRKAKEDE